MNTEQKAIAYDIAFKEAVAAYKDGDKHLKATLERIFPELMESEGERIRKALIKYYSFNKDGGSHALDNITPKQILAWLEKQGEQKPIIEMKSPEESLGISSKEYNEIVNDCLYGESKPIDKIEPKFHEGDIIIHKELGGDYIHNPHKIIQVDILDKKYRLEGGLVAHFGEQDDYELIEQKHVENRQETKHNGGIVCEDFNDGDGYYKVNLAYLSKSQVELIENLVDSWQTAANNSVEWSENDENMLRRVFDSLNTYAKGSYPILKGVVEEEIDWLKTLRHQKPFSKEDKERIKHIASFIWKNRKGDTDDIFQQEQDVKWLKSLIGEK